MIRAAGIEAFGRVSEKRLARRTTVLTQFVTALQRPLPGRVLLTRPVRVEQTRATGLRSVFSQQRGQCFVICGTDIVYSIQQAGDCLGNHLLAIRGTYVPLHEKLSTVRPVKAQTSLLHAIGDDQKAQCTQFAKPCCQHVVIRTVAALIALDVAQLFEALHKAIARQAGFGSSNNLQSCVVCRFGEVANQRPVASASIRMYEAGMALRLLQPLFVVQRQHRFAVWQANPFAGGGAWVENTRDTLCNGTAAQQTTDSDTDNEIPDR